MKPSLKTLPVPSECLKHSEKSHEITPSVYECRQLPAITLAIQSSFQVIWGRYLDARRQYVLNTRESHAEVLGVFYLYAEKYFSVFI